MNCPVCESPVARDAAACPKCQAHLGQWHELEAGAETLYALARHYLAQHDEVGAALALTKATVLAPRESRITKELGLLLSRMGRHQEALVYLERVLAQDPDDGEAKAAMETAKGTIGRLPEHPLPETAAGGAATPSAGPPEAPEQMASESPS